MRTSVLETVARRGTVHRQPSRSELVASLLSALRRQRPGSGFLRLAIGSVLLSISCGDVAIQLPSSLASDGGSTQDGGTTQDLQIAVEGLSAGAGKMCWALWLSEASYESDNGSPARGACVPVTGETMTVDTDLPPSSDGHYAISIVDDENGNGVLDTGSFGIPKEPFGFSNNPEIKFGRPTWSEVRFKPMVGDTTTIRLTRF